MSYDEARSGFNVDALPGTNTSNYILVGDNAYGYSSAATNLLIPLIGDLDTYRITLDVGTSYTIVADGTSIFGSPAVVNNNFALLDRFGNVLALSSDFGSASGLTFTAADNIYYVQNFSDSVGFYFLRLENNSITELNGIGESIVTGATYNAALDYTSDVDKYSFSAIGGATYSFAIITSVPDIFLDIEFSNLSVDNLVAVGSGVYSFTAPITGIYNLHLSSNSFVNTGAYSLITSLTNSVATGSVSVSGTTRQGQVLTASNTLADADGLGTITYQWRSNGNDISGATGSSFTLTQAEVGAVITVIASYTDLFGNAESLVSGSSQIVEAVLSATFTNPISAIDSIGVSPDGQFFLIKVDGITQSVPVGSSLSFNGSTVTTSDLTNSITVQPVFQSSGGSNGYALPEVFTGPASLNLHYQLIETADNAVVIGGDTNDFIKVASTTSVGKAVDGGAGDDVIDGGVGSTFISGGTGSNTIFLDGRAPGVSWSTVTDFKFGQDKATIWGWKAGVSKVSTLFSDFNTGGAQGYEGLTLHFENLLPDDAAPGQTNSNFNSITLTGLTLADFGASSLEDLNAQISAGANSHFIVGQTVDAFGEHGYLFLS
jgi:hypothetical protein